MTWLSVLVRDRYLSRHTALSNPSIASYAQYGSTAERGALTSGGSADPFESRPSSVAQL